MLGYLIPGLKVGKLYTIMESDIYLSTIIIGAVFSILLFLLNKRGLSSAASLQKILCVFLVGSAIIGAIAALVKGDTANLQPLYDNSLKEVTHKSFMGGAFSIITAAAFFLAGFETIPQGVEEAGGDIKSVGKTVVLSVGLACVFYAILLFCFGVGYKWEDFYQLSNPAAANMFKMIYSGGAGTFLYWLITVGALAGLFTTWNGFFTASANLLMAMGRSRMIPSFFAKQDKNGVAINGLYLVLIISLIGPFLGANMIDTVTCFSATAFVLSWMISSLSLLRLRKTMPHANRPFKLATPIAWWAGIVGVIFFIGMLLPFTPFYAGGKAVGIFVVYIIIGIVLHLASGGQRKQLSAHERMKNMFGNLDLDEMRKM